MSKRIVVIILSGFFAVSASYGQATVIILLLGDKVATEKLYLSIDGAMNISALPGIVGSQAKAGLNYGLGVHIRLSSKWYLRPEFKPISRKGGTKIDPITPIPEEFTVDNAKLKINYIDFPVLMQYSIGPNLWLAAGPQFSILTDANQFIFGTGSGGFETVVKVNSKTFFNKYNFSFPVEAGYSLSLGTKKSTTRINVNIFVRYEYDFSEIFNDLATGSTKISLFQVGLSLPFIKKADKLEQIIK
jgi:hypothetical protein